MKKSSEQVDLLIIGGGLVGASLACALVEQGLSIAMVEARSIHEPVKTSFDNRCIALSYGSRNIFAGLGLWSQVSAISEAIQTIHISNKGYFGATRLRHSEEGVDALGYVVDIMALGQLLLQQVAGNKKLQIYSPALLQDLTQDSQSVTATVKTEKSIHKITAKLMVAADGVHSTVRDLLHIGVNRKNYEQCAVATNVVTEKFHQHIAYERFTENGPIAFLPMSGNRCSVVWTLPENRAAQLIEIDDELFIKELQDNFGYRLGNIKRCSKRRIFPLSLMDSTEVVRGRVVIIGNAAHTLHPVAGQGFNLSLRDVATLADFIGSNDDPGKSEILQAYKDSRETDTANVYRFTDGLIKVFANNIKPLAQLRSAGLIAVDLISPIRHHLGRRSMGLSGRVPTPGRTSNDRINSVQNPDASNA